ncbi:MAG: leucyl aminopeptidase family protein, partial [Magnetovibrio sp.]|nr:leucyl aminopeptidase family protein [Magnetovibrio sp.]
MPHCLIDPTDDALPVEAVRKDAFESWLKDQSDSVKNWLNASGFKGKGGTCALLPSDEGVAGAVYIVGGNDDRGGPWAWSSLYTGLSDGTYWVTTELEPDDAYDLALGFALASYRFDIYRSSDDQEDEVASKLLVWPENCDVDAVRGAFGATKLVRDLINTPASDLGPAELTQAAKDLAEASGAAYAEVVGVDLIRENFPA